MVQEGGIKVTAGGDLSIGMRQHAARKNTDLSDERAQVYPSVGVGKAVLGFIKSSRY